MTTTKRVLEAIVERGEWPEDCAEEGAPAERFTVGEWSDLVVRSTFAAWRQTNSDLPYVTVYKLVDEALREAMPDAAPEDGRNA